MQYTPHYNLNKPEDSDLFNVEHFNENATKIDNKMYSIETTVSSHVANNANPHQVTKAQVGLGNVDNTSDSNKPISTAVQAALNLKLNTSTVGSANGVASLDSNGQVPSSQLPSSKIDTAYNHSQTTSGNPHNVTKSDVGLGNVGNFKAVSTVANQGLTSTEQSNARTNIGAGTSNFDGQYSSLSGKPTIPSKTSDLTNDSGFINYKAVSTVANQGLSDTEKANARANIGAGSGSVSGVKGNSESTYRTGNVNITAANIGLGNVGNFKAVSTVANQGLTETEKTNARSNIGAGASSFSGDYNDLTNKPTKLSQFSNDCSFVAQYYQTSEPSTSVVGSVWIG